MKKILILGSGGREAALAWKLHGEGHRVFVAPGNGGIKHWATSVPLSAQSYAEQGDYFHAIANLAREFGVDLIIVGPEKLLEMGVVDFLSAQGLCVFGPTRDAAEVEWRKGFGKKIAASSGIHTSAYRVFAEPTEAFEYIETVQMPVFIKTDYPRSGERTRIVRTVSEAMDTLHDFMPQGSVVVEQVIEDGEELSYHTVCDGSSNSAVDFPIAQDHSQLVPGGPFTGGVGVIVPVPWVTQEIRIRMRRAARNMLRELHRMGRPFRGLLYPQFKGSHMLECNVRFGDPETQAYMRLLKSSVCDLLYTSACGDLGCAGEVQWRSGYVASIAVVSGGYGRHGGKPTYGYPVTGIKRAETIPGVVVFPASVRRGESGELLTDGNRVLHVTAVGDSLDEALSYAYDGVSHIRFQDMDFSPDIGRSALILQHAIERQGVAEVPL